MRRILIVGLMVFMACEVSAQIITLRGAANAVVMEKKYTEIDGSPYLYPDWKIGTLTDVDGQRMEEMLLRYDSYEDQLNVLKNGTPMLLNGEIYPEFVMNFVDEENTQVSRHFKHNSLLGLNGGKGYYEVLYEGEYSLYRKIHTNFINNVVSQYGTNEEIKRFETKDYLVLVTDDKEIREVSGSKKKIYELFGDDQKKIESLAKELDYNVKDPVELALLLAIHEKNG